MEHSEFSREEIEALRRLSSELVAEIAPEESRFFDNFFPEYMKEMARRPERGSLAVGEGLGFGLVDIQSLLTPTVISAVVVGVSKVVELLAAKRQGRHKQREDVSLDDVNLRRIEQELFKILRSWRVGRGRAQRISSEFIALVAREPDVVLKALK